MGKKNSKISRKLIVAGTVSTIIVALIIFGITLWQDRMVEKNTETATMKQAYDGQENIVAGVIAMLASQKELLEQKVAADLNVAEDVLLRSGKLSFTQEKVEWQGVNQFTKEAQTIQLPKMLAGSTWLGQNADMSITSPIVDRVRELVGGTCTIFQRMNEAGDMLRVVTNVETMDNKRAIGTYLPVKNPDGLPNPVLKQVLAGAQFIGRAYVVNRWYVTAYKPLMDSSGNVVGMIYVGVPEESATSLRQEIMKIKVCDSGYVYVLNSQGHYIISQGGKRDGENIWEAKDANGNLFIQDIVKQGMALKSGEFAHFRYPWQNAKDPLPRPKTVVIGYFEPWQWIIGAGTWDEEFFEGLRTLQRSNNRSQDVLLITLGISLLAVALLWFFLSRSITRPINSLAERTQVLAEGQVNMNQRLIIEKNDEIGELAGWFNKFLDRLQGMVQNIADSSRAIGDTTTTIADRSRNLSERTTQQATALTQTTVTLEEFASGVKTNSENAVTAECGLAQINSDLEDKAQLIGSVSSTMDEIHRSSNQISQIVNVINDISFQTNLLALNAAVEAARAGDAGRGFAVVASEVRNLAQKTAESSHTIRDIVAQNVTSTERGLSLVKETAQFFTEIKETLNEIASLISQINALSHEQQAGISQINVAVSEIDGLGNDNAQMSGEFIDLTRQLKENTEKLDSLVALFKLE